MDPFWNSSDFYTAAACLVKGFAERKGHSSSPNDYRIYLHFALRVRILAVIVDVGVEVEVS